MNLLRKLFGIHSTPLADAHSVPAANPPVRRRQPASPEAGSGSEKKTGDSNPFLDDNRMNFELAEENPDRGDPYQSYTWQMDRESDTRKLKTIPIGRKTDKGPGDEFNPYNTSRMRRGWKK